MNRRNLLKAASGLLLCALGYYLANRESYAVHRVLATAGGCQMATDIYEPRGGSSFSSWLMTLARNAAVDQLRRRRDTLPEQALDDAVLDGPGPSSLRTAMSTLPTAQRDVILLRHVVGLSPGEIAARMGRTESSIHGLHNRGRAALRRELCRLHAAPSVRLEA